ncbi:MarR family winged helix-turn-helix transcriptional regulator, partial [Vibrio parahaemolyticus]|nr:MarR family winged helix-turn-helix transcriptional regulator [Vibrio parahaemolyticus]
MTKLQLEQFLPYRLNRIASAVSQDFRSVYGPHLDLTIPEWRVLATLGQFEEMGAKAIGRHSAMHKTKVSRAVR